MNQPDPRTERADGTAAQSSHGLEFAHQQEGETPVLAPAPVRPITLELLPSRPSRSSSKDVPPDSLEQFYCSGQANRSISAVSTAYPSVSRLTQATDATSRCSPTPSTTEPPQLQHPTPTLARRSSTPQTPIRTPARRMGNAVAVSPDIGGACRSETASPAQERKIFVGGVPQDFGQEDLYDFFHEYGPIRKAWLQKCKPAQPGGSGPRSVPAAAIAAHNHRGFGFVVFQDRVSIDDILGSYDSFKLPLPTKFSGGKPIEVKRAKSNNQMQQEASGERQSPAPTAAPILEEPVTPPQRARRRKQQAASSQAKASSQACKTQLEPGQQSPARTGNAPFSPSCTRVGDAADRDPAFLANSPVRQVGSIDLGLVPYHSAAQQSRSPMPPMQLYSASGQFSTGACPMQVLPAPVNFTHGSGGVTSWPPAAMTRMAALPSVQTQPNMAAATCAVGYRPADEERFVQPPAPQSTAMWQQQWQGPMHAQAIQHQPMASHQYNCFQREVQTPQPLPEPEPEMISHDDHRSGTPVPEQGGCTEQPQSWGHTRGSIPDEWRGASEQELKAASPLYYED
mmetsp:Transcript_36670/g.84369  ORF Transcript_36670/g.84369 Transcript_36670/m.84369 type:complete len:568 (-) Transcript_36670:76-1779(-)